MNTQADLLLRQVTQDRDSRCAALRAATAEQARQLVRTARTQARRSLHDAVTQERARLDFGLRQAAARADIELRRREQGKSTELLAQMWSAMAALLAQRWQEPVLRREWIAAAITQTGRLLAGRAWLIESATDWTPAQRVELTEEAQRHGAASVGWSLQALIPAGLKIRAERVCVDATVPGLLAQRDAIEAAFLAEYLPERHTDG